MGENKCQLLGGTFANFMQISLAAICVLILIYKRQSEVPRREWAVWMMDVTKQGLASSIGHFVSMYYSIVIAKTIVDADECMWYCVTHVFTSSIGTAFKLLFLHLLERYVQQTKVGVKYLNMGDYGTPPSVAIFGVQMAMWTLIVVLSKVVTFALMSEVLVPLNDITSQAFKVFDHHPDLELIVVMILVPTLMNVVTFWITDNFLKKKSGGKEGGRVSSAKEESGDARPTTKLVRRGLRKRGGRK